MNRIVSISGKLIIGIAMLLPVVVIGQKAQSATAASSSDYWQQRVKYVMDVDVNASDNKFTGKQKLEYWNNSPDTLTRVFYHLYWNAFQPGSLMDLRSLRQGTIPSGEAA